MRWERAVIGADHGDRAAIRVAQKCSARHEYVYAAPVQLRKYRQESLLPLVSASASGVDQDSRRRTYMLKRKPCPTWITWLNPLLSESITATRFSSTRPGNKLFGLVHAHHVESRSLQVVVVDRIR